ncbi:alpha/beta hydrolase [Parenemella sanctibonifatiensis]|uniref:Acetyl xylan esterase domain-containing protein n=1 Tax=Parenemella sanctibonifatiensis TaxID=2016505 RepID=A0A255EBJ5_9ACTN|nr:hypothetical protein [Parenemella sanctibonifatiensis]OYN88640.1 hypothetical protein CGZ91_13620 [Parenemella sanctibonifatiensis]
MDVDDYFRTLGHDRAIGALPGPPAGTSPQAWREQRRDQVWQDWGLAARRPERDLPPAWHVTGAVDQGSHVVERGWFEASPGLVITANLYRPAAGHASGAGMLYFCGHSPAQKIHYQDHPRRLAQLGFTTLIVDTLQYGEIPGKHHGLHRFGEFWWVSRGYSPAAAEAWVAVRAYDLLVSQGIDSSRIGVTGHSGGGAVSWWAAVLEPRIAAVVTSTGTVSEISHLDHRTLDSHCDCYFPVNPRGEAIAALYSLVAPRPTLILAPRFDLWCAYGAVVATRDKLADHHAGHSREPWPLEVFGFEAEHEYTPASRRRAFGWLTQYVRDGGAPAPELPADIDGVRLPEEDLRVFGGGAQPPRHAANETAAAWLTDAEPVEGLTPDEVAQRVWDTCFGFAEDRPPAGGVRIERRYWRAGTEFLDFSHEPEPGWRVEATLRRPLPDPGDRAEATGQPLRVYADHRAVDRLSKDPVTEPTLQLAVRGSGRSAWHPARDWHVRRAAVLLGRPLAAMRALDILRGLQAYAEVAGQPAGVHLYAGREMAVPALLAAVLEPSVTTLEVTDLPASMQLSDQELAEQGSAGAQPEVGGLLRVADVDDLLTTLKDRGVRVVTSIA